ncbi:MAG: FecR family protein [Planctomycetota bacterium]
MEPRELCQLYLMDEATPEQVAELSAWIAESPDHAEVFALLAAQDAYLSTAVGQHCKPDHEPAEVLLGFPEIDAAEQYQPPLAPIHLDATGLTRQKYRSALSYVVRHTFTPKRVAAIATAAALVLGAVLTIVLISGPDETDSFVELPESPKPKTELPTPKRIVATLTDERDAVWDRRPGDDLYAGQRFTLTQGVAELTTSRGAVAVLQAPATVELIDDDNAIRLHTGRLVGLCETDASHGFTVHTPHLAVTDLGTRFGVDASDSRLTSVIVFEGEVRVTPTKGQAGLLIPQRLVAGQSLTGSASALVVTNYEPQAYNALLDIDDLRPRTEGGPVVWKGMLPLDMRSDQQEGDALQVYLERRAVVLKEVTTIDMMAGDAWPPERGFGKASVPSGTAVDVYLLHMDRVPSPHNIRTRPIKCVIRFDRPIVGVIAAESTLRQTDAFLSVPGALHSSVVDPEDADNPAGGLAGLEFDTKYADSAVVSDDGMSLELQLFAPIAVDQIRVLVQSQQP